MLFVMYMDLNGIYKYIKQAVTNLKALDQCKKGTSKKNI